MYDPARDVAHLSDPLLAIACNLLDEDPDFIVLRSELGVSDGDLMAAVQALVNFVSFEDPPPEKVNTYRPQTFEQHMNESGLPTVNIRARMLITSAIGDLFLAAAWQGKRAASAFDQLGRRIAHVDTGEEVARAALALRRAMTKGRAFWDRMKLAARILIYGR
jgi:hypothetical protein